MNKTDAKKVVEKITNEQLQKMFEKAKNNIVDWKETSVLNKGMTKGFSWNIFAKDFDLNKKHNDLVKTNMVREFGEFLPEDIKPKKVKGKRFGRPPIHEEPNFDNFI